MSFTWITKINPNSWRELLIFCHPKLQCFCLSIRKSVRLPLRKYYVPTNCLQKYHVPTNWQPCRCSSTGVSSVVRLCFPNRFICICIYLKLNEETKVLERKTTLKRQAWSYEEMPCCFYIRSSCSIAERDVFLDCFARKIA